ncbi:activating signal cointegrator 1 complex subunit 1 [Acyrthosiphon pisum]|uniref:ACYPI008739 protein n=1 Tax=Acyrthosiphon pisum TaxID=7029 RepID=C4WXR1_ACYPI|nr:activating signal cointegrator 1 complex subunit 1 [Acyrthosiphon pisum]BAH72681.1 ACYPI008739 [Acyrthosiphon pisum]|eukprot:NP_001280311.1 activating signal cointegrator 1 complex subunit 1 [Acyrthosiphon pisum]
MDVLRPKILNIDGRQYRLNTADCCPNECDETETHNTEMSESLPAYVERDDIDEECDDLNIYMEGGRCVLKLEVPNTFYGLIIGRSRENLKHLEYQTKTRIKIPSMKEKNIITIKGEQRAHILSAKSKIDAIVKRGRAKQSMTHFVSLPMVNPIVIDNYLAFKKMVLDECGQCRGVTELLFQDQLRLHLTITCFVLCDAAEIKRAINLMDQCENTIIKPMNLKSLDILVSGLDCMNDDPSEVNVLYAKVKSPEIQMLADKIQTFFQDCDLALPPRSNHVKLHVTLMNTGFYEYQASVNGDFGNPSHLTFDARKIIEKFNDYTFGTVQLTDIHLSQRHTTDSNGYYKSSTVLKL